ncbi:MAG: sodium:solute symporter family protein [Pseudomonadota bacterium]
MSLVAWSWLFLVLYIALMVGIGLVAQRRVAHADDFATARGAYGPVFLAFAFAASTASGATFLGSPALSYEWGYAANWSNFLYPMGLYFGVLICMRLVATAGNRFGNRSIPEYLGDRYQSDGIRVLVSVMSLVLFFYLAGQLVSGLVMFEILLGLSPGWALIITSAVLLVYVVLGGAHADILTDGIQGFMMLALAVLIIVLFLMGYGLDGGLASLTGALAAQDENLVTPLNSSSPLYRSWWSIVAIVFAHMPLGLLPHLGNKLWALNDRGGQPQFVKLAFLFGLTMAMIGVAGLLARAVLGDVLYAEGATPNAALPMLFLEFFPTWLAALIGVAVLSAIMSTADGLVVSSSQIVANDLYRRTWIPWQVGRGHAAPAPEVLDRRVLLISRIATVVVLLFCMALAWAMLDTNIAIIVWIGNGGMMAAFAGPLVVGALWRGVTRYGAYAGLLTGFGVFALLITQSLDPAWFPAGAAQRAVSWLHGEGDNPYSCAAMGEFASVAVTVVVSRLTRPLPQSHLDGLFGGGQTAAENG